MVKFMRKISEDLRFGFFLGFSAAAILFSVMAYFDIAQIEKTHHARQEVHAAARIHEPGLHEGDRFMNPPLMISYLEGGTNWVEGRPCDILPLWTTNIWEITYARIFP